MKKKQYLNGTICLVLAFLMLTSCNSTASKERKREAALKELQNELESMKSSLPIKIPPTDLWITNIELNDSLITYTCEISEQDWQDYFPSYAEKAVNSDRNVARIINTLDTSTFLQKLMDNGIGIECIYTNKETKNILMSVSLSSQRLNEIKKKMDNGEITPYSILEIFEMEIKQSDIPCYIEDGVWLTDAYINGNNVYYEYGIEEEADASDIDYSILTEIKNELVAELKATPLIFSCKKEMIMKNVNIFFIYKDNRGEEYMRIRITPTDIFQN